VKGIRITVLGAAGGQAPGADTTAFLLGDQVLLDAGAIGLYLTPPAQFAIRHVLLTHTHLDHLHALPFLLDTRIGDGAGPVTLHGTPELLEALRRHVFNGLMWPDFTRLPSPEAPVARLEPLTPGRPFPVADWTVTAVPVRHTVPAVGYLLESAQGAVVFSGDTGPTEELWARAAGLRDLRAVFLETSFPAERAPLAALTRHLTTADVAAELAKAGVGADVPVFLYHLKPGFREAIGREAAAIGPWRVRPVEQGEVITI
jgi:ribonuclease BN (tRNA processing enzyme)